MLAAWEWSCCLNSLLQALAMGAAQQVTSDEGMCWSAARCAGCDLWRSKTMLVQCGSQLGLVHGSQLRKAWDVQTATARRAVPQVRCRMPPGWCRCARLIPGQRTRSTRAGCSHSDVLSFQSACVACHRPPSTPSAHSLPRLCATAGGLRVTAGGSACAARLRQADGRESDAGGRVRACERACGGGWEIRGQHSTSGGGAVGRRLSGVGHNLQWRWIQHACGSVQAESSSSAARSSKGLTTHTNSCPLPPPKKKQQNRTTLSCWPACVAPTWRCQKAAAPSAPAARRWRARAARPAPRAGRSSRAPGGSTPAAAAASRGSSPARRPGSRGRARGPLPAAPVGHRSGSSLRAQERSQCSCSCHKSCPWGSYT